MEIVTCREPTCGAPAEVVDRFRLASTDGPVEHLRTCCARGHGLVVRLEPGLAAGGADDAEAVAAVGRRAADGLPRGVPARSGGPG